MKGLGHAKRQTEGNRNAKKQHDKEGRALSNLPWKPWRRRGPMQWTKRRNVVGAGHAHDENFSEQKRQQLAKS